MVYDQLVDRLKDTDFSDIEAIGLPDGSIDNYCRIEKGENEYIQTREEAVRFMENNPEASLNLIPERVEPGGKSVNMSIQTNSLGADTVHYGFLDHEVFEELSFETFSMGEPADVTICEFEDGSLLTARIPDEMIKWDLKDLGQFSRKIGEKFSADTINCANHSNIHTMNRELEEIAELRPDADVFNFDPGSLKTVDDGSVKRMFEALSEIDESCEVIVHVNTEELETTAEIYGIEGTDGEKIKEVRDKTGVTAYILHDKESAIAGTERGVIEIENFEADRLKTQTGAGDRFDAAVGIARAKGWNWKLALALGNISAVHYLEENESGSQEQLMEKVREKIKYEV